MQNRVNPKFVIGFVAIVALIGGYRLFGQMRMKREAKSGTVDAPSRQPASTTSPGVKPAKSESYSLSIPRPTVVAQAQELSSKDASNGLVTVGLKSSDGFTDVAIHVKITKVCHFGDVDAVLEDLAAQPSSRPLLTLEPLAGSSNKTFTHTPSSEDLSQGFSHTFRVPTTETSKAGFGLHLCNDGKRQGFCREKVARDLNDIFSKSQNIKDTKNAKKGNKPKGDEERLYYFEPLLLVDGGAKIMGSNPTEKQFTNLQSLFGTLGAKKDSITLLKRNITALKSVPLRAGTNELVIVLPRMKTECDPRKVSSR